MKLLPLDRRLYFRVVAILLVSSVIAVVTQLLNAQAATTFTVNSLGDNPDAIINGVCADAGGQCTLRAAIEEANSNGGDTDIINFSVTGTINLTGPLPNLTNMTINGPGSDQLTVRRNTGGDYRVLTINGFIVNISGLTVTNGKTLDGAPGGQFFGNQGGDGAGIFTNGVVTLTDVVVTGNRTGNGGSVSSGSGGWGGFGAGIHGAGTLTLTNVTVSNNITGNGNTGANGGGGGRGGGIYFTGTSLTMTNCRVIGNTTGNGAAGTNGGASGGGGGDGAGVLMNSGTLTMNVVILGQNHSGVANFGGTGGVGGGLMTMPGVNSTLFSVTADHNTTGNGGGGVTGQGGRGAGIANHGVMIVRSSLVSNNVTGTAGTSGGDSGGIGGGIFNGASIKIVNTTISANSTSGFNAPGGGIYNNGSSLSLVNSTVTGNAAVNNVGNGVYQNPFFAGPFTIGNTIVAQNVGGPDTFGTFTSQGNNLIGNADDASGFVASDLKGNTATPLNAMLGPLTGNGGSTLSHALLPNGPALDAGNNAVALDTDGSLLHADQRGSTRIVDWDNVAATATVDIGAFEFFPTFQNLSNTLTREDTAATVFFNIGDGAPAITSLTATSSNQTLVPNANLAFGGGGGFRSLQMTPAPNRFGITTITMTINLTGGGTIVDSFDLDVVSVNDAPSFTKGPNQTVNEDSGPRTVTNWATALSVGPNETGQTLSFTVTHDNPSLFSTQPAISPSGTLTFTPAPNAFGSVELNVSVKDNGGTINDGQDTSAGQTFTITVNEINDAPSFTKGPDQTVAEDPGFVSVFNWATGISFGPPNEFQFVFFVVTNNTNPSLFAAPPSVTNQGTLNYLPAFNASGFADITIVARDNGGTTNGGINSSGPQTFRITVTPVNDAPVHNFPFFSFTNQQTPLVFSTANFNLVSVTDVDAGANAIRVTLATNEGTLSLGSKAGLTFSVGDGTDDATMTFAGTTSNINVGLNGLTYKPTDGFSGSATIQVASNDNGNTGAGGAKSTSTSFNVQVASGGRFTFNTGTYGVNENGGTATITVLRSGGSAGVASVTAATTSGTATAGSSCTTGVDYLPAVHTFTWNNGDTSPRQFTVSICNDSVMEGDETINLTLDSPTGTGSLGTPATAVLTIGTDDGPVLLFNAETQEAIALDLVNQIRDPFSLTNPFNMSEDQRRRISLFVWQTAPLASNEVASVTATIRDDQFRVYQLQVEALHPLPEVPGVTQVIVKLPDSIIGAPRDMLVQITVKGLITNEAFIHVTNP